MKLADAIKAVEAAPFVTIHPGAGLPLTVDAKTARNYLKDCISVMEVIPSCAARIRVSPSGNVAIGDPIGSEEVTP